MILPQDRFDAFLDLGQHGMDVTGEFSFCDADLCHRFDDSVYLGLKPFLHIVLGVRHRGGKVIRKCRPIERILA